MTTLVFMAKLISNPFLPLPLILSCPSRFLLLSIIFSKLLFLPKSNFKKHKQIYSSLQIFLFFFLLFLISFLFFASLFFSYSFFFVFSYFISWVATLLPKFFSIKYFLIFYELFVCTLYHPMGYKMNNKKWKTNINNFNHLNSIKLTFKTKE